jgi:hypothetical protein
VKHFGLFRSAKMLLCEDLRLLSLSARNVMKAARWQVVFHWMEATCRSSSQPS